MRVLFRMHTRIIHHPQAIIIRKLSLIAGNRCKRKRSVYSYAASGIIKNYAFTSEDKRQSTRIRTRS